ncbi:hypothetical protein ACFU67_20280 [Streptomyces rhizosphaericola]|uniref:hypothetical protein n=1 Tax=Streptomyces TaxID=1883 RepID=UPI0012FF3ABD|nr:MULTISPECIES: hypothetical protein [unclassified Streptomyces]MYT92403.1 hypothetical protein [Streptomyces sp. SID8359]
MDAFFLLAPRSEGHVAAVGGATRRPGVNVRLVRVGHVRVGRVRFGMVRLGMVRLDRARLGLVRPKQ